MPSRWSNILLRLIPSIVILGLTWVTIAGPDGLLHHWELQEQSEQTRERWVGLEEQNTELLLDVQRLGQDPINLERLAADELGYARPGAVIYRFDDDGRIITPPRGGGDGAANPLRPSSSSGSNASGAAGRPGSP